MGREKTIDMTRGEPLSLVVRFSLPLLVGNALFIGLSIGASVMIAQFIGSEDRDAVRRSVNTVYGAFMVSIVPLTLFGLLISGPVLRLIQVPESVYGQAHIYLLVVFAGIIGSLGYNINAGILQGLGDSRTPLLFLAVACVINIVLDLVFVLVFHWGVFGVALATIVAQFSSWIFGIFYVNRKYRYFAIRPFRLEVEKPLLRRVLRLGVPSGIQQCQLAVAVLVLQALINSFGEQFAAGFSAANKIDTFAFMPIDSFALAMTTYVGQNVGAGRLDRVKTGVRKALVLCIVVCAVMSALVVPNADFFLSIFSADPAVIQAGRAYLDRVLSTMVLLAVMYPLNNALRRCDDAHGVQYRGPLGGPGAGGLSAGPFLRQGRPLLGLSHRLGHRHPHQRHGLSPGPLEAGLPHGTTYRNRACRINSLSKKRKYLKFCARASQSSVIRR